MSAVGAERRALHGAEHRSSMDRVMAGASAVFDCRHLPRADGDMVFDPNLFSICATIRPCIASSRSYG